MIITIDGQEAVIESKVYQNITQFNKGKGQGQVAYYADRLGLDAATYLVFVDSEVTHKDVLESVVTIKGVTITTYLVRYDLKTDFKLDPTD